MSNSLWILSGAPLEVSNSSWILSTLSTAVEMEALAKGAMPCGAMGLRRCGGVICAV